MDKDITDAFKAGYNAGYHDGGHAPEGEDCRTHYHRMLLARMQRYNNRAIPWDRIPVESDAVQHIVNARRRIDGYLVVANCEVYLYPCRPKITDGETAIDKWVVGDQHCIALVKSKEASDIRRER